MPCCGVAWRGACSCGARFLVQLLAGGRATAAAFEIPETEGEVAFMDVLLMALLRPYVREKYSIAPGEPKQ